MVKLKNNTIIKTCCKEYTKMDANCKTCYPPLKEVKVIKKAHKPALVYIPKPIENESFKVEERFYILNHKLDQMVAYTKEILDYVKSK